MVVPVWSVWILTENLHDLKISSVKIPLKMLHRYRKQQKVSLANTVMRKIPINKEKIMKIEKEHLIGMALGLTPLFVIAIIFRDSNMLYTHYIRWYTTAANTVLTSMGVMELIEELKRYQRRV